MKTLLASLSLVLLIAAPLAAQNPIADTIPQLKEWWRADNMQYAKYGMTWLDNFYNGKGALVVWTPQGVKTWLLRFPGDTMNVFTWEKGSSNIQTGDFNGDGATDYVDENGNVYQGIKNGEPPNPLPIIPAKRFSPWSVGDFNNDGLDDIIDNAVPLLFVFGKPSIQEMKVEPFSIIGIDTNNVPLSIYKVNPNEMRIVCRHYYWTNNVNFPFRSVYKDGLRLVRVWWDGNGFKSEVLDEFTVNVSNNSGVGNYSGGVLLKQTDNKVYWLGSINDNLITIYNLSKNKLEVLYTKIYGGGALGTLRHSIDNDTVADLFIYGQRSDGMRDIIFYSGNINEDLHPIYEFITVQLASLISLNDITGDGKPEIALSNYYIVSSREKYRFSILTNRDTTNSVVEDEESKSTFFIRAISPMPVLQDKVLQVKVSVPKAGNYTLSLFDRVGRKVPSKIEQYELSGEQILPINIGNYEVSSGAYTLQLEGYGKVVQCSILIQ